MEDERDLPKATHKEFLAEAKFNLGKSCFTAQSLHHCATYTSFEDAFRKVGMAIPMYAFATDTQGENQFDFNTYCLAQTKLVQQYTCHTNSALHLHNTSMTQNTLSMQRWGIGPISKKWFVKLYFQRKFYQIQKSQIFEINSVSYYVFLVFAKDSANIYYKAIEVLVSHIVSRWMLYVNSLVHWGVNLFPYGHNGMLILVIGMYTHIWMQKSVEL